MVLAPAARSERRHTSFKTAGNQGARSPSSPQPLTPPTLVATIGVEADIASTAPAAVAIRGHPSQPESLSTDRLPQRVHLPAATRRLITVPEPNAGRHPRFGRAVIRRRHGRAGRLAFGPLRSAPRRSGRPSRGTPRQEWTPYGPSTWGTEGHAETWPHTRQLGFNVVGSQRPSDL